LRRSRPAAPAPWYKSKALFIALGLIAVVVLWEILSIVFPEIIIASPAATAAAFGHLAWDGQLWSDLGITLQRLVIGLFSGSIIGIALGVTAGLNARWRHFLEPVRWVEMTIPAIVVVVLAMLWFGLGSTQAIFMTAFITMPFTYVNTLEGMLAVDERIVEMSHVYRIPHRMLLTEVYLPGIGSSIMAGLTLAAGVGVRAVILAEFMGAQNGIGHSLLVSWNTLNTPELFAWILMCLVLLAIIEFGALLPIRRYLMRWKRAT
jgi:NitT/TauT family transport system permease protein